MKDIKKQIETSKGTYPLVFNLNVMEELQEKFGSVQKWGDLVEGTGEEEPNIKALKYGFMIMVNEGIDMQNEESETKMPFLNEKQVGRIISEIGMAQIGETIKSTTTASVASGESPKNM